jgi:ABC-2 type transport system permease protein
MGALKALALRTAADARVRTLSFAAIFAIYAVGNVYGYGRTYPTVADRIQFAQTFGENKAIRLFYGTPYSLETVGGYTAWRVGGLLAIAAAFLGAMAATRALRGEEESGRAEIVAAGAATRAGLFFARIAAIAITQAVVLLAMWLGLVIGGLPALGSAYLVLVVTAVAAVYMGVGAVASQLASTGREALELAGAVLAVDLVLRVVADTTDIPALHWASPLGWAEETRAFAGERPWVLAFPALASFALLVLALALERRRDIGASILQPREVVNRPGSLSLRLPALLALRSQLTSLAIWSGGVAGFGVVLGTVSKSVADAKLPQSLKDQLEKLGAIDFTTPSGYIGLVFLFFILAISFFGCSQLASIREDEAEGRLETLFALPSGRVPWLAQRLALAVASATCMAIAAGLGASAGVLIVGAGVKFHSLIEAGLNCLPASMLFLGIGALLLTLVPRAGVGMAYAVVGVAFIWELLGSLIGAPSWVLGMSPFHQVGLVPGQSFRAFPAVVMVAIGLACAMASLVVFRHRDLVGG